MRTHQRNRIRNLMPAPGWRVFEASLCDNGPENPDDYFVMHTELPVIGWAVATQEFREGDRDDWREPTGEFERPDHIDLVVLESADSHYSSGVLCSDFNDSLSITHKVPPGRSYDRGAAELELLLFLDTEKRTRNVCRQIINAYLKKGGTKELASLALRRPVSAIEQLLAEEDGKARAEECITN